MIELRSDGGEVESETEGDGSAGLDGSQIRVEMCRIRGGGGMGRSTHNAPRMEGGARKSAGWVSVNR